MSTGRKKIPEPAAVDDKADAWVVTYGDMMSLLLTFFILLVAMMDVDPGKMDEIMKQLSDSLGGPKTRVEDKISKMKDIYNELEKLIQDENMTQDVELTSDNRGIVLFAKGGILFKPGEAEFEKDSKYFLNGVSEVLRSSPNKILVEGHTDDEPVKSNKYPTNWELSTARASAVIRHFTEKGGIDPARCQAVGYAQYKPRYAPIPENRAKNRRVEIVLLHDKF
jgi:chemotaxis protein MotB